jgi:hypothetical protein
MAVNKKCIYISSVFILIGLGLIGFSIWMSYIIHDQARQGALMTEETSGLWGYIPGQANVSIFKIHNFFNLQDLEKVFFLNSKLVAEERGPYTVQEYDEMINRTYSPDNSTVSFKMWRYHHNPTKEEDLKQQENITTINLPSLGVWYQAKNASPSQIALKGLYTIYKSLISDFFYGAIQTAIQRLPPVNSTEYLSIFPDNYFSEEFKKNMTFDKDFGLFGNNNAFFVKAVLTHPSSDSKFLMDYYNLQEVEMKYLKNYFMNAKLTALKNDTNVELATKQWLDLSINAGDSISKLNSTAQGFYLEYGAYLKFILGKESRSNLTYDQARKLFFEFNDPDDENYKEGIFVDDSGCLINKKNLDIIFDPEISEQKAVEFINNNLSINNFDESKNIYGYLKYIIDEVAVGKFRGGNGATAAISDFLSQAIYQIFNSIGWDSYLGILQRNLYSNIFIQNNSTCIEALERLSLPKKFDINLICNNPQLDTKKFENIKIWLDGILYKDKIFKNLLNNTLNNSMTEYDYISLTSENSNILKTFLQYVDQIFTYYNIKGNYKAMDLTPLAVSQFILANVTQSAYTLQSESVKEWNQEHYKVQPEFVNFLKKFNYTNPNITVHDMLKIANFDNLYNSRWISDRFIEYSNKSISTLDKSPFASKEFIQYLRYVMVYEVLNLFTIKKAYDLLWGYDDELLKLIKETNYFLGGDPTVVTKFSFLNNMTEIPEDWDIWSMYTGVSDYKLTRAFKTVAGYNESYIIMKEPYFDGKNTTMKFRNPWRDYVKLNGTDALSMNPDVTPNDLLWAYLDDLFRTCSFTFNNTKVFNKLTAHRFVLTQDTIYNSTLNHFNKVYYSDKYNGFGNLTSVFKVPMYASKPYYWNCDNLYNAKPEIKLLNMTHQKSEDEDDQSLYYESWIDVEPYTGAVLRAAQKLLISAYIEKDELFEIDDKFVPIYNIFRTGNFTQEGTDQVLGDLFLGLTFKQVFEILGVTLTILFVSIVLFYLIRAKMDRTYRINDTFKRIADN